MHLGVIGYGNIAQTLLDLLSQPGAPAVTRVTLLVRPGKAEAVAEATGGSALPVAAVETAEALIAGGPDLVVECAGHAGVTAHVPAVLRAGIDTVVVSIGAMSDDALATELKTAAKAGGARIVLPAGAVGGIDLLSSLSASGPVEVTYRGIKPPKAWAGTPAEAVADLDTLDHALVFFEGTAREAASQFPKNANVAATLALAGAGLDATRVELIADPAATGNIHAYEVRSSIANYSMKIENLPSRGNAKTSVSTIYSVLREIRNRLAVVAI